MTSRVERVVLYLAVFLGGALLMALEISAFRIIGKTFGTALRETTAVIAVFLAAMSLGYWAGGRVGDSRPRPSTLVAVLFCAAATTIAVPWIDAWVSPSIASSGLDYATHAFLSTALLFALPTMLFASISPIAIRLVATTTGHSGTTAGSISAISTVGSIAGSVATAFVLLDWLGSISRTVLFLSLIAAVTGVMVMLASVRRMLAQATAQAQFRRYVLVGVAATVLIVIPAAAFIRSTSIDRSLMTPSPFYRMVFTGDSRYHHVSVRDWKGQLRLLSFAVGSQSTMRIADPYGPGIPYTESVHISKLMRPTTKRVLILGLGGGTVAKQMSRYYTDTVVDVVEIDPMVADVAQKYFFVEQSDRLRIHVNDGRVFLRNSREKWDLILVDAYTSNRYGDTIPPHMATREFFQLAAAHLNEGGIVQFHCAFSGSKVFPALQKTMAGVFRSVLITGGEIFGSDVPLITAKDILAERAKSSPAARLAFLPRHIAGLHAPSLGEEVPVLTDDYAPVDTLANTKQ